MKAPVHHKQLILASGRAGRPLAEKIAKQLKIPLEDTENKTFTSGEIFCSYKNSIRDADLVIVQTLSQYQDLSPNDNLMELMLMIDAARRAAAGRITLLIPYYGYCRQDKKSTPREPISAAVVANMIENAGVDCVVVMDLHAGQIQGFFHRQTEHLTSLYLLADYVTKNIIPQHEEVVIVSPDAGRVKLTQKFSKLTGLSYALLEKQRPEQQKAEIGYVIGDVQGKAAVILDDMIDTGGTLRAAAETLIDEGASHVYALATHGVLSGNAFQTLDCSALHKIVVTDTIPISNSLDKLEVLETAAIWAMTVKSLMNGESISQLFDGGNQVF